MKLELAIQTLTRLKRISVLQEQLLPLGRHEHRFHSISVDQYPGLSGFRFGFHLEELGIQLCMISFNQIHCLVHHLEVIHREYHQHRHWLI